MGLVLGNIRLPVIVLAASSPAAGAGANIGISAVAALTAAVTHVRAGRIDWRVFAWMAPPSIAGAVAGGLLSGELPGNALLALIGVTLLVFGVDLLRPRAAVTSGPARHGGRVATVVTGAAIGLLGGLVGLILGALRLPALLRVVGADPFRRRDERRGGLLPRRRRCVRPPDGRRRLAATCDRRRGVGSRGARGCPAHRTARRAAAAPGGWGCAARRGHGAAGAGVRLGDAHDFALGAHELELPSRQVALGLVEKLLGLPVLTGDTGHRQPSALPELVMVDLGDRHTEAVLQLRLRGVDVLALPLERTCVGKVQLDAQDPDVARAHRCGGD